MGRVLFSKKGFTLIEIIVSLAVLSIIAVSFSGVFTEGFSAILSNGHKTEAIEETQKVMDAIYKWRADNSSTAVSSITQDDIKGVIDGVYGTDAESRSRVEITEFNNNFVPDAGVPVMCRITIKVTYDNGTRFVCLTSLIP